MIQYRKYGTQCTILFPLIKASSQNFAVSGDYTHASGDVKISKDGGAAATATNSPSALTMGNGAVWTLTLSATEMQAAEIVVTLIDAATKAVEDQCIIIHTHGNASAMLVPDLSVANLAANVTQFGGSNATTSSGRPEVNTSHIAGSAVSTSSAQIGVNVINAAGTAWNAGAIKAATFAAETGISPVRTNTCQSGSTSTTIKLDASASSTDDFYKYQTITITGGTGAGQSAIINSYVGSTKVATVNKTWATTPDATSTFCILRESELQSSGSVSLGTNAPSGWINAAAFSTDAITSTVLAANAASEIASAVRTELTTELGLIDSAISGIPADVDTTLSGSHGAGSWTTATGFSTLTGSDVRTAVGLASANLDTQLAAIDDFIDTEVAAIKAVTDKLDTAMELDSTVYRFTTNALEQAPSSGLDAAGVRSAIGLASANLDTQLGAIDDYLDTEVAAIKAKTDNLPASPAATSDCITAAGVRTAIGLASANLDTQLTAIDDYLDTEIAAIKAKTDNLPASPAATSDIPSAATISSTVWAETTRTLSNPAGLQKNTAVSNFNFVLVDSSDNPITGATVTATRSIDGGSFASCTNSASEIGSGVYKINLSASDLNGDVVTLMFAATGAKSRLITIFTEP